MNFASARKCVREGSCQTHRWSTPWIFCELVAVGVMRLSPAVCWWRARLDPDMISKCGGCFCDRPKKKKKKEMSPQEACVVCMHECKHALHEALIWPGCARRRLNQSHYGLWKVLIDNLLLDVDRKLRNFLSVLHSWWVVCWSQSNTAALICCSTSVELVVGHIDVVGQAEICIDIISLELGWQESSSVSPSCGGSTSNMVLVVPI